MVPRGCLLRRVNAEPFSGESIEDPLLMAGFQGNKASAWAVQVRATPLAVTALRVLQHGRGQLIQARRQ